MSSESTDKLSLERYIWGLKKSASRARQLAKAQKNPAWDKIAYQLDILRENGVTMAQGHALTRQQVLTVIDRRAKSVKVH